MAANPSLGVLLQPSKQHRCNRLPLPDGTVIRVLAAYVRNVQACAVMPCNAVGDGGIGGKLYDISVRLDYLMVAHGFPAKGFLPVTADGCDGSILRGGRAMHDKVGYLAHGYSSGFRRG